MNHFLHGVTRAVTEAFDLPAPVLEVGSYQVAGQESVGDLRGFFPGVEYTGIDFRAGPGVDRVADVERLPFADGSFGTVVAHSVFEHVRRFWDGFAEVTRVLRPDGVLLVSVPFYFHQHGYPSDYWRMTPEALEVVLEDYPTKILGSVGPERRPGQVWVVAFKEKAAVTEAQFEHYRQLLAEYGKEPIKWAKWLRYRAGRLVFGRRPFSPYLERDRWTTVMKRGAA